MKAITGKYGVAKVFTDLVEQEALDQVQGIMDHEISENSQVRFMPDIHFGKGATVGTTIRLSENFDEWKVSPNIVGVDVSCAILMYKVKPKGTEKIDLAKLDLVVNEQVPSGMQGHLVPKDPEFSQEILDSLTFKVLGGAAERIHTTLGTLGGGNHFIELGKDENGDYWLSVHSGSRNLGVQVAKHHQDIAISELQKNKINLAGKIQEYKDAGRHKEIQEMILKIKAEAPPLTYELKEKAFLQGQLLKNYLHDMDLAHKFAARSRQIMLDIIVEGMDLEVVDMFDSVHNFIEHDNFTNGTIRKGATSAKLGERLVIPLNMRDGSIIAKGLGNKDWNESAPHGAGRMLSRSKAREVLSMQDFKKQMEGIYTTSVMEFTLDEAPDAYKPAEAILENIKDTVEIVHVVKPVYNFKAKEELRPWEKKEE